MKLLFDNNISSRMVFRLQDIFPDACHISQVGLDRATDLSVWQYAKANHCCIVTKDSDFCDVSILQGFPPQIIWIRTGNCTTSQIETVIRNHETIICRFLEDAVSGILALFN